MVVRRVINVPLGPNLQCLRCRNFNRPGARFCTRCGSALDSTAPPFAPTPPAQWSQPAQWAPAPPPLLSSRPRVWIFPFSFAIGALVLGAIGVMVALFCADPQSATLQNTLAPPTAWQAIPSPPPPAAPTITLPTLPALPRTWPTAPSAIVPAVLLSLRADANTHEIVAVIRPTNPARGVEAQLVARIKDWRGLSLPGRPPYVNAFGEMVSTANVSIPSTIGPPRDTQVRLALPPNLPADASASVFLFDPATNANFGPALDVPVQ